MPPLYYLPPFLVVALLSGLALGAYRRSLKAAALGAVYGTAALYLLGPVVVFGGAYLWHLPELIRHSTAVHFVLLGGGALGGAVLYGESAERPTGARVFGAACAGALGLGFVLTLGFYLLIAYVLIPGALVSESAAVVRHLLGA